MGPEETITRPAQATGISLQTSGRKRFSATLAVRSSDWNPVRCMPSVTFSRIPRAASVVAERKGLTKMGKASARLKLMYVEGDEEVLKQHALTLEKAGHHVTSIVGRKDAMEQLKLD